MNSTLKASTMTSVGIFSDNNGLPYRDLAHDRKHVHCEQHDRSADRMRNLRAIALPWVAMVIASVVAAAVVSYQNQNDLYTDDFDRFLETNSIEHHSVHKPVYEENHPSLFPLSTSDKIGFSLAICGLMIAAGGGIGGGGILVPIYILVMGFSPKHGE